MKEYKNIDELFKDAASGFEPQPSAKVWAGIEEGVFNTGKSKRMTYIKWTLAAMLLLLIGVSSMWYFTTDNNQHIAENEDIIIETTIDNTKTNNEIETNILETEIFEVSIVQESDTEDNVATEIIPESIETKESIINDDYLLIVKSDEENEMLADDALTIEQIDARSIYEIAYLNAEPIDKQITVEEYLKKRRKLHTYTGVGIKAAMVYYPNTEDQFTYTAEANFGIVLNKFYIEAGVGYQQMKERGVYKFNYKSNDSIGFYNKVVSFEIDPLNPDNITYKTTETTVYDSINHYSLQSPLFKYSYLNVPLKVGYKVWGNNKLTMGLETGIIFSKLISSEIPEPSFTSSNEQTLVSIEDNTPTRVDMNMQMLVAMRFNYKFTKAVSLSLQPEFTKYLNSIYNTDIGDLNIKPYTMGLRFGIYYDF